MDNQGQTWRRCLPYATAAVTLLLIARTVIMIAGDGRQTPFLDIAAYAGAVATGVVAIFIAVFLLFGEDLKNVRRFDAENMTGRLKMLAAIVMGMLTTGGVMYLYARLTGFSEF